jgi:hypothetical protein
MPPDGPAPPNVTDLYVNAPLFVNSGRGCEQYVRPALCPTMWICHCLRTTDVVVNLAFFRAPISLWNEWCTRCQQEQFVSLVPHLSVNNCISMFAHVMCTLIFLFTNARDAKSSQFMVLL